MSDSENPYQSPEAAPLPEPNHGVVGPVLGAFFCLGVNALVGLAIVFGSVALAGLVDESLFIIGMVLGFQVGVLQVLYTPWLARYLKKKKPAWHRGYVISAWVQALLTASCWGIGLLGTFLN